MDGITPGWKTTEFWGKNITQVMMVVTILLGVFKISLTPEMQGAITAIALAVIGGVEVFYTKKRTDLKIAETETKAQIAP